MSDWLLASYACHRMYPMYVGSVGGVVLNPMNGADDGVVNSHTHDEI